jgi:hypothetical protein
VRSTRRGPLPCLAGASPADGEAFALAIAVGVVNYQLASGDIARDVWVRGWLVRVHAVLEMWRLRIRSLELVGRVRDLRRNVGGVRVGPATPKERPATVELSSNRRETTLSRFVQLPPLRFVPEAVLLIDQGIDALKDRALAHGRIVGPPQRSRARSLLG